MGVAYYISLEQPIEGFDASSVSGKALAKAEKELAAICKRLKIPDLMSFFSMSPDSLGEVADDGPAESPEAVADALAELRAIGVELGLDFRDFLMPEDEAKMIQAAKKPKQGGPPGEKWFRAADGLKTVRGLLNHLAMHPVILQNNRVKPDRIVEDLRQMEAVLDAADKQRVRFHLSIDF